MYLKKKKKGNKTELSIRWAEHTRGVRFNSGSNKGNRKDKLHKLLWTGIITTIGMRY